jgi:O-antigen/teichoic acid export membrane protein
MSDRHEIGAAASLAAGAVRQRPSISMTRSPQSQRLFGNVIGRQAALVLVDQVVVSGASFMTTILVGRYGGPTELGAYSLGFTVLVVIGCVQESLVSAPYSVRVQKLEGSARAEYAGSALAHYTLLALAALISLLATASMLWVGGEPEARVLGVLAMVAPCTLLRDFRRRLAFAHFDLGAALRMDVAAALLQAAGLLTLALTGVLSAATALAVTGVACGVAGGFGLASAWRTVSPRRNQAFGELGRSWSFGKWVLAGQLVSAAHGSAVLWLAALTLGPSAAGTYAASTGLLMLSSPFILGVSNLIGPKTARSAAEGGGTAVRRVARHGALVLGGAVATFSLLVAVFGDWMLRTIYGEAYAGHGALVALLAAAIVPGAIGLSADHGLRSLGRPDRAFRSALAGLSVTVTMAAILLPWWGLIGGAWGFLAGSLTGMTARWKAFWPLASEGP